MLSPHKPDHLGRRRRTRTEAACFDVLIAGAGPAGLFAALSLAAAGGQRVLLIDAGPDIEERRRPPRRAPTDKRPRPDYERGVGGAGLFSDGKLCLSLDVGGHLGAHLDAAERAELEADIEAILLGFVDGPVERGDANGSVDRAEAQAKRAGLGFKYYPVAHIGTDRCRGVVAGLRDLIREAGVAIWPRSELMALERDDCRETITATVRTDGHWSTITARQVVLALGKVGAAQQSALCRELGIPLRRQRLYAGVRFEAPADRVAPLFSLTKDPKYSLHLSDGSKIKTHCATRNGEVLTLRYSGLPLAGGHNYSGPGTARSGFSILWNGIDPGEDSYETALALMRSTAERTGGALLVQRLSDLLRGRPTTTDSLSGSILTCSDAVPGDIRGVLPPTFLEHMRAFLTRLELLAPGLTDGDAVVYGPAIEWWTKQIAVTGPLMTTIVPGVSVCGDGSGWSQGIVHAAATGLLAARGIHGKTVRLRDWSGRLAMPRPLVHVPPEPLNAA